MPLMIPRIIHQTYKTSDVPDRVKGLMRTWAEKNPGWKTRFYNDAECYKFVEREFPEYYDAYVSLPKDVERSDFFRVPDRAAHRRGVRGHRHGAGSRWIHTSGARIPGCGLGERVPNG